MRKIVFIGLTGIWISCFEFLRNEILLKNYWIEHFKTLGLEFKTAPANGILWMVWSFTVAVYLYVLMKRFSFLESILLAWASCFFLMWIALFNLQVLPRGVLIYAVPMSLIEVSVAAWIIARGKSY